MTLYCTNGADSHALSPLSLYMRAFKVVRGSAITQYHAKAKSLASASLITVQRRLRREPVGERLLLEALGDPALVERNGQKAIARIEASVLQPV